MPEIRVSALVIRHPEHRELLMVRKSGTQAFMLPGGKPEPGECARHAIIREVAEELHLELGDDRLVELGTWTAAAANEAGHAVTGTVFAYRGLPGGLNVTAPAVYEEIAEAAWFSFDDLPADTAERRFASLTRECVIPNLPDWLTAGTSTPAQPR